MFINDFHRQSVLRCLQKISQSKSSPINCEEEVEKIKAMHREIAFRYPQGK